MADSEPTHNLRKRGPHVYTGASEDQANGRVLIDVQDLPESPASYRDIPKAQVTAAVRRVTSAAESGKDVLIRCAHGINRSPTIAKLALMGMGESFNASQYWPNEAYRAFVRMYSSYYKNKGWEK
jgi:protein-tyrosine phosphatase